MDICFVEVSPLRIRETYPTYFHEQARYFRAMKDGKPLCFYGIITRPPDADEGRPPGEAFLMMKTFQGKVLSKGFFEALFAHAGSLGYGELWTWTTWDRLINLFHHFKSFGVQETESPPWDTDPAKTWFIKRGLTIDKLDQGD